MLFSDSGFNCSNMGNILPKSKLDLCFLAQQQHWSNPSEQTCNVQTKKWQQYLACLGSQWTQLSMDLGSSILEKWWENKRGSCCRKEGVKEQENPKFYLISVFWQQVGIPQSSTFPWDHLMLKGGGQGRLSKSFSTCSVTPTEGVPTRSGPSSFGCHESNLKQMEKLNFFPFPRALEKKSCCFFSFFLFSPPDFKTDN